jgi:[ribosomal protein S18]-alanine N-acetyltransferase
VLNAWGQGHDGALVIVRISLWNVFEQRASGGSALKSFPELNSPVRICMIVRRYQASDLSTLSAIDRSCFSPEIAYSREELEDFINHRSSITWVAEESGEIAGFVVASRQPSRVGHIITIDVVDAWRRRGVGSVLMDAAESWARKAKLELMYLETAEDNLAAQNFYEARDYRKVDKVDWYYSNSLAAWVMVKRLK